MTTATIEAMSETNGRERSGTEGLGQLKLVVIRDSETIVRSREPWNELAGHHPFMRWEWIASWWQSFGTGRQAAVLTVRDEQGRWVGLFPLHVERRPYWGRVLSNMGNGRACSDHVRPIFAAGYEKAASRLLTAWICEQAQRGAYRLVEWDGADESDFWVEQLSTRLAERGFLRHDTDIEGSWIAQLPADWPSFERITKKCFRRKMQKAQRNRANPGIEIATLASGSEIRANWPTFMQLHHARRRELGQHGCFQEERFGEFLLAASQRLADQDECVLMVAKQDGKPFGALLLLLADGRAHMYQSGYDPAASHIEPGHLLTTCAVQFAIERGMTHFDFLRGDEAYKARWNTVRQPMKRIRLASSALTGRLRLKIWIAWRRWRDASRVARPEALRRGIENNQAGE